MLVECYKTVLGNLEAILRSPDGRRSAGRPATAINPAKADAE